MAKTKTVGEALVTLLEHRDVDFIFGIPGVHTVELYRGLETSTIRHITPRHELGAGFMADGYARASGKAGVCLLITGPGLTNAITAMAQARADSIPMLIISAVNPVSTFGKEEGHLHELPDQSAMMKTVTKYSATIESAAELEPKFSQAFAAMNEGRPGPVHIEIPLDVMGEECAPFESRAIAADSSLPDETKIVQAAQKISEAKNPVVLAGGGSVQAETALETLANKMGAPVVTTINARGLMAQNPLRVPASPSLQAVRTLLANADLVLAVGTQMGPTDYDFLRDDKFPSLKNLIRIDVDEKQILRGITPDLALLGDAGDCCQLLSDQLKDPPSTHTGTSDGALRAKNCRDQSIAELSTDYRSHVSLLETVYKTLPGCIIVGDSTQLVYAGNSYLDVPHKGGWFNSSVGYGALGYAAPAAIGAQLAKPDAPIVCVIGDGGFQFCLSELGTAMDEKTPVIFLVWNNGGYGEIKNFMQANAIAPIGTKPSPPNFVQVAKAYGIAGETLSDTAKLKQALKTAAKTKQPYLIEIVDV